MFNIAAARREPSTRYVPSQSRNNPLLHTGKTTPPITTFALPSNLGLCVTANWDLGTIVILSAWLRSQNVHCVSIISAKNRMHNARCLLPVVFNKWRSYFAERSTVRRTLYTSVGSSLFLEWRIRVHLRSCLREIFECTWNTSLQAFTWKAPSEWVSLGYNNNIALR